MKTFLKKSVSLCFEAIFLKKTILPCGIFFLRTKGSKKNSWDNGGQQSQDGGNDTLPPCPRMPSRETFDREREGGENSSKCQVGMKKGRRPSQHNPRLLYFKKDELLPAARSRERRKILSISDEEKKDSRRSDGFCSCVLISMKYMVGTC